ncbi:asparagine synthase (glutamine-hydrolyzing) [Streptomyces sp. N2-109]|uniref:asparagine synthase (glutamine-hydrolyzing) n=1 Tax=Streptomyces gossypii TaxID=2883101 RepID=A0ABT2JN63_9ACTN|nr:asparagine synthase (glutamine-hydrolyzing) [Streptomyces gossypii]MCT2589158.1 asparagine synthase (glutamine-hydrolyzing) [Streptomyces gossypii]
MCGIAGWVDFDRDLTRERATVTAMTETMALRGPDGVGVWLDRHVGLGHRRLAVIDIEGGRQPMAAEDAAVLTYSGEVYNFRELRAQLEAKGHHFRSHSDTEVVLRAYLEWGEGFVTRLNGIYAFALWDSRREELLLVRDRMGVKPLFYYPLPDGGVLFGSEPKAILAHPRADRAVDADGLREIFTITQTPGTSVYKGMHEVPAGHLLKVRRQGLSTRRYWSLQAREHPDDLATTIHTVRDLLEDIVERQLVADVPLCSLLSGGLDSSALTALAMKHGDIRSFAVDFDGYADHFQPDEMRGSPDGPYARDVVAHLRPDHTDLLLDTKELTDPRLRSDVLRAWEYPQFSGDMNSSLYMLFRSIQGHSTVALSGESADEVFGGYAWFHLPAAVAAPTFPWLVVMMQKQRPEDLFDPALRKQLDVLSYERDRYGEALAEVPYLPDASATERRMREISYLHLTRFVSMLLDRKDRLSMAHGLEVRVPFCDHRLVEYVFNTPWSFKSFDGREKSLLRAAVSDLLPSSVLERRKSPYPATQDPAYGQALRGALTELVAGGEAPVLPLLDQEAVRKLLRAPAEDTSSTVTRISLEMVLDLNAWLEDQELRVDV